MVELQQIYSQMQVGQNRFGMETMNQALLHLVERDIISLEDAMDRNHNLEELKRMVANSTVINGKKEKVAKTA